MSRQQRILIDCDPGVDDAIALLLALAAPTEIELLGITCVAGNVPLAQTVRNALRVCALAGRADIPVLAGCARAIMNPAIRGSDVHGTDGLGDSALPDAPHGPAPGHAVDFIIDTITAAPGAVTLCAIGPMTNLALAFVKRPDIAAMVQQVVFMGGAAFCPGNVTPTAEYNVFTDPHAAQIVLSAGVKCTMIGLDVTNHVQVGPAELAALAAGGPVAQAAGRMLGSYGRLDPRLHDPCVIAHLLDPTLFTGVDAEVAVACDSPLTLGQTVVATRAKHLAGRPANCRVLTGVDAAGVFGLLTGRLSGF